MQHIVTQRWTGDTKHNVTRWLLLMFHYPLKGTAYG